MIKKGLSDVLEVISNGKPNNSNNNPQNNTNSKQPTASEQVVTDPSGRQITLSISSPSKAGQNSVAKVVSYPISPIIKK